MNLPGAEPGGFIVSRRCLPWRLGVPSLLGLLALVAGCVSRPESAPLGVSSPSVPPAAGAGFRLETDDATVFPPALVAAVTGVQHEMSALCPGEAAGEMRIVLHARRRQFAAIVPFACAASVTSPAFTDLEKREIHICLEGVDRRKATTLLLHECTHGFLHVQTAVPPPTAWGERVPAGALPTVPLWLHEGLAAYMEVGELGPTGLVNRGFNLGRWRELDHLIRGGRNPSLRQLLAMPPSVHLTSAGYAAAWGVVYALRTGGASGATDREGMEARLRQYIAACRREMSGADGSSFPADRLPGGATAASARQAAWDARLSRTSLALFETCFLAPGQSLETWEGEWCRRMLRLRRFGPLGPYE